MSFDINPFYRGKTVLSKKGGRTFKFPLEGNPYNEETAKQFPQYFVQEPKRKKPTRTRNPKTDAGPGNSELQRGEVDTLGGGQGEQLRPISEPNSGNVPKQQDASGGTDAKKQASGGKSKNRKPRATDEDRPTSKPV
jgi:hypothetical protein